MRIFRFLPILLLLAPASYLIAAGKIFPYPYIQEDLPNGLRLITIPTDYPNIVWVCLLYDDGPTPRRIESQLIFADVEVPVGVEVATEV
jgi:hypothetical protein